MNKRLRKLERKVLPTNLMKQMNKIFDLYFNNTNVSVAVVDLDIRVLQVNNAFEKLYGWSNEEVIGETLSTVPSHLIGQLKNNLHSVIQTDQALNFETHKLRKSGELFHASVTITPLKDNTGGIFALVEVARDISVRKMEDEKLKESEEQYRNLVELSPQPIVVYSDFIIVYVNPAALKLLGAEDGGQLLGKSVLEFIHPDYVHELHMQEDYLLCRFSANLAEGISPTMAVEL
jgi:two-component system sporulation sensor kinase A